MAQNPDVPNREELLQMAIRAARAGQKQGARVMFRKVLAEDKRNERAIMWMAKLATSAKERRQWLDRAVNVNPENVSARQQIEKLDYEMAADRNRGLLRIGIIAWVAIVLVGAVLLYVIMT